jgi:hypothetical protein
MTGTKSLDEHALLFGVYDNKVYHHCAGFRDPITMIDRIMPENAVKREFSMQILDKLKNDQLSYF